MKGLTGVGDTLSGTLSDLGLYQRARKYQVFSMWPKIVGDIAKHARPRRLQDDILFVATASSVWSQELYYMRDSILAQVNQALGGELIKEIRFSEHMWSAPDDCTPGPTGLTAGGETSDEEVPAGVEDSAVADAPLLRALRRAARTMARRKRYLTAKGYRVCDKCGSVYPAKRTECPACKLRREFVALARAIAALDRRPETGNDEISRTMGLPNAMIAGRARVEVESRLVSMIQNRLAAEAREAADDPGRSRRRSAERDLARAEIAAAARRLASLRACAAYETMSQEDVERAVGRRYAALAKKA